MQELTFDHLQARDTFIINNWIQFFWEMPSPQVSDYSHGLAWKIAKEGDLIPYEAVFISDEPVTFEEVELVKQLAKKYGWKL